MARWKKTKDRVQIQEDVAIISDLLEKIDALLLAEKGDEARVLLENVPGRLQHHPMIVLLRATVEQARGDDLAAIEMLEGLVRKEPDFFPAYMPLANSYANMDYWAHAWDWINRRSILENDTPEMREAFQEMQQAAQERIQWVAQRLGLSFDHALQACRASEKAQLAIEQGKFQQAIKEAELGLQITPKWTVLYNHRALALWRQGQMEEAIAATRKVLEAFDADNIPALANLILFLASIWDLEQMRAAAKHLKAVVRKRELREFQVDKAIEGLGIAEESQALWELAQRLLLDPVPLQADSWYVLGNAAANSGHLKEAIHLYKKAQELAPDIEAIQQNRQLVDAALKTGQPVQGSQFDGSFPYISVQMIWPPQELKRMLEGMPKNNAEKGERYTAQYVTRHPNTSLVGKLLLWDRDLKERSFAIDLLAAINHPEADAEILRFATSAYGSDQERMGALVNLQKRGKLDPNQAVRFYSAARRQWHDIRLQLNQIGTPYVPRCKPRAMRLLEDGNQALTENHLDKAAQLLEKALEADPQCAIILHNLGTVYMIQDREAEAEPLLRQAVALDPNYLFGYTSLAELELERYNLAACRENLDKVFSAPNASEQAYLRALAIHGRAALIEDDYDTAEHCLEMIEAVDPNSQYFSQLEDAFDEAVLRAERWNKRWLADAQRYRQRALKRPITADANLAECLDRIPAEILTKTLQEWGLTSSGKKAEKVARLHAALMNPKFLEYAGSDLLDDEDQQALAWVLKAGGIRPLAEFIAHFGDDPTASPYWQYHEPKTAQDYLRFLGLLAVGDLDGETLILVPSDFRPVLKKVLKQLARK